MSRVITTAVIDSDRLPEVLSPRRLLVVEADAGDGVFVADHGPVSTYERRVEVSDAGDGRSSVRQTVTFELAVPFFGWLFERPFRRTLGRLFEARRVPWWAPPDPFDAQASTTLATLAALTAVAVYPAVLLAQTIEFVREDLGFSRSAQSVALAVVRADVLLALGIVAAADRRGRRRLALESIAAGCLFAALSALSPDVWILSATQLAARGFLAGAAVLVGIMAAEEMPAGSRAYAVSILVVSGALGAGLALGIFPVADLGPSGWRIVFAVAILGIPLTWAFGRRLPESRRFRAPHRDVRLAGHGARFWLLAVSAFLFALFVGPASQYQNVFLRHELGFSAARISLFIAATNVWGGIGIVAGGRLADVRGRRVVAACGVVGGVGATVLMFFSTGWPVWAWSVAASVVGSATVPALGVYGPELFPTSLRGRANGIISGMGRLGTIAGLVLIAVLLNDDSTRRIAPVLAMLAVGPALLVVLVLTAYPETARRELEELNPEDAPASVPRR